MLRCLVLSLSYHGLGGWFGCCSVCVRVHVGPQIALEMGLQHISGRSAMARAPPWMPVHWHPRRSKVMWAVQQDNLAEGSLITRLPKISYLAIIPTLGVCAISPVLRLQSSFFAGIEGFDWSDSWL